MREEWTTWWSRKELSLSSLSSLSLLASTEEKKKNKDLWILPNILIRPAAFAGRSRWHWRVVENSSITSYNVEIPDEEKKKKVQEQKKTRSQPSCKAGIKWNVSAEKSKSTEGFFWFFFCCCSFFSFIIFSPNPKLCQTIGSRCLCPQSPHQIQHIRSSPAWIGLLFFFPSLFRIDLFVVCAAVVAAEIDKRAWEKQRIFSIQSASKKIRKNLSPSSSNWEWRILSIIQLMTSLYATMKLHFVRPCASPTHNRAGLCYAPAHDDGFQTEIPASQTNFCCAPVWLTPFLLRSATVQIFYIAESGWGWPAGRWHVYSSSFRDATQSSRAVCPSSIS